MYFKPRIFISSTMGDKLKIRKQIKNIFEKAGAEVALYEKDLTPSTIPNTYRQDILQTDFVIFIIDERYGAKTGSGLSGTEEEFNIVTYNNKLCHVYLKEIEKTDEAKVFEDNIKSKGISYYYYKNEKDLLNKLQSTCFTIAKNICEAKLLHQKIEPKLITKLAVEKDYAMALGYIKLFEAAIDISNNSNYDFQNSNLSIAILEAPCEHFFMNKNLFIDKKLEDLFRNMFQIVADINGFISTQSTTGTTGINYKLFDNSVVFISYNQFNNSIDNNFLPNKIQEMISSFYSVKSYVSAMKLEADLI